MGVPLGIVRAACSAALKGGELVLSALAAIGGCAPAPLQPIASPAITSKTRAKTLSQYCFIQHSSSDGGAHLCGMHGECQQKYRRIRHLGAATLKMHVVFTQTRVEADTKKLQKLP